MLWLVEASWTMKNVLEATFQIRRKEACLKLWTWYQLTCWFYEASTGSKLNNRCHLLLSTVDFLLILCMKCHTMHTHKTFWWHVSISMTLSTLVYNDQPLSYILSTKPMVFLFQTQAERCSLFLVDRKQQELVAKVFDGNMLPDGTVEVGMLRMLRVLMRQSSYFLIYVDDILRVHFNIDKGWH